MSPSRGRAVDITELLQRWSRGERDALDHLFPLVYEELRKIAARQLRHEQDGQSVDPTDLVHEHVREALQQLPSMIRIRGDAVSLDYAIDDGTGVVRLRLREGMAHQMQERDIPELDRPVRFTVVRGGEEAIRAASLPELKLKLKGLGGRKREFKKQPKQRHQRRKRR